MSNRRRAVYFLAIILSIIYLLWRIFFTIRAFYNQVSQILLAN